MKKRILIFCILVIVSLLNVEAQQTSLSSGGDTTGNDGSLSYSIGQVFYQTNHGTSGSISQGTQLAFEAYTITDIANHEQPIEQWLVYPNPVSNVLILNSKNKVKNGIYYGLFDLEGRLLDTKSINNQKIEIDMTNLKPSIYLLKVFSQNMAFQTFKIIKH